MNSKLYYLKGDTDRDTHDGACCCGIPSRLPHRAIGASLYELDSAGLQALYAFVRGEDDDSFGDWCNAAESQATYYGLDEEAAIAEALRQARSDGWLVVNYLEHFSEILAAVMQQITQMQKKHLLQANQAKVLPGEQIILTLSNGYTLRSGGSKYELGAYARICNEQGLEMVYWSSDEVRDASEQVLGAIFGAILHPERAADVADDQLPTENIAGQDEKRAAKVLTWNGERLSYSSSFSDSYDPDGEEQIDAEELIAAHLFDEYDASGLFEHTRWVITFVVETFFRESPSCTVRDMLQLMETLSEYLVAWQNQLTSPNEGPNEEEAATAGRNTLLLTLRFLNPEWVKIDTGC